MFYRTSALMLLLAGLAWAQTPEPIQVQPRVIPTDQAGDPLPQGATARMGTLRWRHSGPVQFVGFLADGQEVVSASLDGWIRVWDVATGREIRRWKWHQGGPIGDEDELVGGLNGVATIRSIVLSPDRRLIAASLPNGKVRVWNIKGNEEHTFGGAGRNHGSNGIAFSPDGKTLATRGDDHQVLFWNLRTGTALGRLLPPRDSGERGNINYYGRIGNTLAFSPDGKLLAVMNSWNTEQSKGVIILYEVETGKELRRIEGGERSLSGRLAFGPGVLAAAWGNRETKLYDPETGKELRQLGEPKEESIIHALLFSPDGKTIATRSATMAPTIQLWDVETGKKLGAVGDLAAGENDNIFLRLAGPGSSSMTVDFSPDGKRIADATGGRVVRVYEMGR